MKKYFAARDFEAQLLGSLLESMEKTFATVPGDNTIPGEDDYNCLGTRALASALAASGGFGIAHVIAQQIGSTKVRAEGISRAEPLPELNR